MTLKKKIILLLALIAFNFLCPFAISAAEVLQITNASTLLIGDQNRNYKIKLACLEVKPEKEAIVIEFLTSELPRHSRVNLKPQGSEEGILISRIISLDSGKDIGELITSKEWAQKTC